MSSSETRGGCLVVGGFGFIGSNLVRRLSAEWSQVRVMDLRREPAVPVPRAVELIDGDYGNEGLVASALAGVSTVFHLASVTTPSTGADDPIHDVQANLVSTLRLLEVCVRARVKRVVFISSGGTVYGPAQSNPIAEEHPLNPICSYGVVKRAIESYLAVYRSVHGLEQVVLRVSNPYGPGQYPFGRQGVVAAVLGCLWRDEVMPLWGDGTVVRDFLYVDDLSEAFVRAATTRDVGDGVFNIGAGAGRSIREVMSSAESVTGRALRVRTEPGRAIDVPVNVLDCRRASSVLGWRATTPMEDGLRATWSWINALPPPRAHGGDRPG